MSTSWRLRTPSFSTVTANSSASAFWGAGVSASGKWPNAASILARTVSSELWDSAATSGATTSSARSRAFASSGESRAGRRKVSPYSSLSTCIDPFTVEQ